MERMGLVQGTREEIIRELDSLGADAARLGKTEKAREFARAIEAIKSGDGTVIVHKIRYDVLEG